MSNRVVFQILSPLLLFLFHVLYLVFVSSDPFLKKWIDGSFTFFVALVLCNIIRARAVASREAGETVDDGGDPPEESGGNDKP